MKSSMKVAEVGKSQQKLLTICYKIVKNWHKVVKSGKSAFSTCQHYMKLKVRIIIAVYELREKWEQ